MVPGYDVPPRIHSQKEEHEREDQEERAEEVDPLQRRLLGLFDGDAHEAEDQRPTHTRERDQNEKGVPPAPHIVDPTPQHAAESSAQAVTDIGETLPHAPPPQRHQIRPHKRGNRCQSTPSCSRHYPSENHHPLLLRQPTDQIPRREHHVRKHQPPSPGEDVGQPAAQGLQSGVRNEVRRREPGEEGERGEGGGDWG